MENEERDESPDPHDGPRTWKEKHGGAILAGVSALLLVAVVAFQMNC